MRVSTVVCFLVFLSGVFAQVDQAVPQTQQQNQYVGHDMNAGSSQNPEPNNQQGQQHNFQRQSQPSNLPQEDVSFQNPNQMPNQQVPQQQQFNAPPQYQQFGVPQQPNIVPMQQPNGAPPAQQQQQQQFNVPPVQQYPPQPNVVPLQQPNEMPPPQPKFAPVQQPNGVPPAQQQRQQFNVPPIQQHPPQPNEMPAPQQQQLNIPSIQQQPLQPNIVPIQQPNGMFPPQQAVPQPQLMQQQFNGPPFQQPGQPNVVPQYPDGVPQPQAVPQQPPVVPLPQAPQQAQQNQPQAPVQPPNSVPPHMHNEETPRGYDRHGHDSLPLKPLQKKYEPPLIINNDNELDFYSRLPSPLSSIPEVDNAVSLRPFITLTVNVTPGVKDCYFYEAPTSFIVDVQVVGSDGGMDIGLAVFDPSGSPIVRRDPTGEASVTISVQPHFRERAYAVCLDNRKASYARKKVYLGIELHIDWNNPNPVEKEVIDRMKSHLKTSDSSVGLLSMFDNFDRVTDSLDRISGLLHRSQRLQQRTRNNLAADRAMMQANKDRVTSWSTFQACLLVLVGVFQTLLIRSLFDTNSSFHRLWIRGGRFSRPVPAYSANLRY
ncbi:hypothetical protein Aperf_G00000040129 [Anoplocephala perfoliata]